jgi:transposase-like protein
MSLEPNYSVEEVARALGMSTKWVYKQVKDGAEHIKFGHKIKMTAAQVDKLRAKNTRSVAPAEQSVTTGRKRRAS